MKKSAFILSILIETWLVMAVVYSPVLAKNTVPILGHNSQETLSIGAKHSEMTQLPPMASGVVLVGFRPGISINLGLQNLQTGESSLTVTLADIGVQSIEPTFPTTNGLLFNAARHDNVDLSRIYRLRLSPGTDILSAIQTLKENPAVAYAEPDYLAHITTTPNDPIYGDQWALTLINTPAAWDVTTGTTDVVIAVVDSGLDISHPDLSAQIWTNPGEVAGNNLDDDSNGYIDDLHGWNFVNNNSDLSDNTGHGTAVGGIIAATTNNNAGIAGLCWHCRLMVVKVVQMGGIANYSDIAAGVVYAAQKGAKVINISLGGDIDSITLKTAIASASQTAVIVAGVGNNNSNDLFYPAAYSDYVLAVAGTTQTDTKVNTSSYGTWVDVSAPGEAIATTFSGGVYGITSGTSLAASFVSGLSGLLFSQHPDWSPNQVRTQIIQTTDNIDSLNSGYTGQLGTGRLNAGKAVTTTPTSLLRVVDYAADGQLNGPVKTGSYVSLTITLRNDWGSAANVTAILSTTDMVVSIVQATASYGAINSMQSVANSTNPFQILVVAGNYGRIIPFRLDVIADGVTSTLFFTATTESQAVIVGGAISTNSVWTNDRIYHVTGNIVVNPGVTLTIQAGTLVKFDSAKLLAVRGTLIADGTPSQPILFTAWTKPNYDSCTPGMPCPGEWGGLYQSMGNGGIVFTSESQSAQFDSNGNYLGGSIIRHSVVEYSFGGIFAESATPFIDHNLIWNNRDTAITCSNCSMVVSHNRIINNRSVYILNLVWGQADIRKNLIANNMGCIRVMGGGHEINSNTITANTGTWCSGAQGAVCLGGTNATPIIQGNNLYANQATYEVVMGTMAEQIGDVIAPGNYWGMTNTAAIQSRIYDFNQNSNAGIFTFVPFLNQPNPSAPPILYQLFLNPASPVGLQSVTFNLIFSRPMDQSFNPSVTFGATAPFAWYSVLDNAQWVNNTTWRATFEVTSLVPRGAHKISVGGARDTEGMEIPTDTRFNFIVDYAGEIIDQTPPPAPIVLASGKPGDPSYVEISWMASDPESAITAYRYAIGSAPGVTDIVNWTTTTSNSITRSGLGLFSDRQYWVSVQARNIGGLWSTSGYRSFVAGQQSQSYHKVFMPVILRN